MCSSFDWEWNEKENKRYHLQIENKNGLIRSTLKKTNGAIKKAAMKKLSALELKGLIFVFNGMFNVQLYSFYSGTFFMIIFKNRWTVSIFLLSFILNTSLADVCFGYEFAVGSNSK